MSGLNPIAIDYLRKGGRESSYPDGATILQRGEPGKAFYVVVSGMVDILLVADDGRRLPLTRLGEGASFGEMSLLTDEPISADVVARGEARLLVFPAERFQTALAECAELRNHILVRLCEDLRQTSSKAWNLFQRAEALRALAHATEPAGPVVIESPKMRKVGQQLSSLALQQGPILITGEPGTGKLFAARKVHELAGNEAAPLIVVDCPLFGEGEAPRLLFGSGDNRQFGGRAGAAGGLHVVGAVDLADGGTIILRHVEALDAPAQEILSRYLEALREEGEGLSPRVRVVATTCRDVRTLAEENGFDRRLAERLSVCVLTMPRMLDRRRDILPLANLFLEERSQRLVGGEHRFNRSAEHALVSAQYRYRNAAELREAVDFAVLFADGSEIGSEHIFTGPKDEGTTVEYDLAETGPVRWLLDGGGLRILRAGVFVLFVAIAGACLIAPDTLVGRIANGLSWGLWWPALLIAFLFIGRAWCAVCPICLAGSAVRRLGSLRLPPPQWIKTHTPWLVVVLFLGIVWSEHVFGMTYRPFATGILFVALAAAAAGCCVLYERQVWCRYLCPLGSLGAGYSVAAMVRVRANPSVCATQCKTHECFKGTDATPGCPVFHHPLYARDGHLCKLCLTCLRSCPHGSAKLYLRPPLQGIWRLDNPGETLVFFALAVFFLAPVMLGSHSVGWLQQVGPYTVAILAAAGLGAVSQIALKRFLACEDALGLAIVPPVAFAMLVLASGPLMAFHLANIPGLAMVQIHAAAGSVDLGRSPIGQLSLLTILQVVAVLISAILGAIVFWRIRVRFSGLHAGLARWRWRLLIGLCDVYLLAALGLILLRGVHP